mgnify:CR=1 FL=1
MATLTVVFTATALRAAHEVRVDNDFPVLALSQKKTIKAEKKWLLLPVKNGVERKRLDVFVNGEKVRWIDIELAEENPDWYAYLDISDWEGKTLELAVDGLAADAKEFSLIKQSNKELDKDKLYNESQRGQIHFSPKRGWNNDPNGLVYYEGEYHLFFQHNPYGSEWGNMHWGHAVSKDLVHWKEVGEALYPDEYGPVFSGSGVVDKKNTSGFGSKDKPAMVVSFTSSDDWIQGIAYSNDGRNFKRLDHPAVPKVTDGNRDPKVIWYEPEQKWVMVLWVEKENRLNTMHFFSSKNLKDWELTSTIEGGIGDDRYLFECPDLYELPVQGMPGAKKWVITAANGEYAVGTFDGEAFHPEESRLTSVQTQDYYAAQTFTNDPQGRKIEIGWFRTKTNTASGNDFNQSMGIATELKLISTDEGIRLSRKPVEEFKKLRGKRYTFNNVELGQAAFPVEFEGEKPIEIQAEIDLQETESITLDIKGVKVIYDAKNATLQVADEKATLKTDGKKLKLSMYVDRTGLEIFANDGVFFMPVSTLVNLENNKISIMSKGKSKLVHLEVYELKSIWK